MAKAKNKVKLKLETGGKGDLRARAQDAVRADDVEHWDLGDALDEVRTSDRYRAWGFQQFRDYCEQELMLSLSRANRLRQVTKRYRNHRDLVSGIAWSCLSEALPLVKQLGLEGAVVIAREGLAAIRAEKARLRESRKGEQGELDLMETSWRQYQIRMSMPPDAWQALDDALTLAREACLANGSTWDERNPWQLFQAIAIESQEGLRAAVPAPSCVPA